ncbi:MAG: hypothetical protein BWY90_01745 [Deltaproteobacteria bacterium ADurb.BinA014]|nr:MAG: hypothetical protein BWY90_01745 [Deltaproteobacteria bacterium ADurb.BinA014]
MTTTINKIAMKEVIDDSAVKHNIKRTKKEKDAKIMIYGVPREWIEAINKNSMAVSKFARNAMEEKLKRDGLIK